MDPVALRFLTTVVLEAAEQSLKAGKHTDDGVFTGVEISIVDLLKAELGDAVTAYM